MLRRISTSALSTKEVRQGVPQLSRVASANSLDTAPPRPVEETQSIASTAASTASHGGALLELVLMCPEASTGLSRCIADLQLVQGVRFAVYNDGHRDADREAQGANDGLVYVHDCSATPVAARLADEHCKRLMEKLAEEKLVKMCTLLHLVDKLASSSARETAMCVLRGRVGATQSLAALRHALFANRANLRAMGVCKVELFAKRNDSDGTAVALLVDQVVGTSVALEDFLTEHLRPQGGWTLERSSHLHEGCGPPSKIGAQFATTLKNILAEHDSLTNYCDAYKHFGLKRVTGGWRCREWLPDASRVFLTGDFNKWRRDEFEMENLGNDLFERFLPTEQCSIIPGTKIKLHIQTTEGEWMDRMSPWTIESCFTSETGLNDTLVPQPLNFKVPPLQKNSKESLAIYQIAVPLLIENGSESTEFFATRILPRITRNGYNTLLIHGLAEFPAGSCDAARPSHIYAISRRWGTPKGFGELVTQCHRANVAVLVALNFATPSESGLEGLGNLDGHGNSSYLQKRLAQWGPAVQFDLTQPFVLRYLLANVKFFIDTFNIDGFVFQNGDHLLDPKAQGTFSPTETQSVNAAVLMMLLTTVSRKFSVHGNAFLSTRNLSTLYCKRPQQGGLGFDGIYFTGLHEAVLDSVSRHSQLGNMSTDKTIESLSRVVGAMGNGSVLSVEDFSTQVRGQRCLRVAMFAWESLHSHTVGGVAPHVTQLAAGLTRLGMQVHVFVRATENFPARHCYHGVQYYECAFALNSSMVREMENMCASFVHEMLKVENENGWHFDICHAHDWLSAKALKATKQAGRRCIQTIHSTEYGRCGNNTYGGPSKEIRDVEAEACSVADRIICVSGVLASEVCSQYAVNSGKTVVIYNGIDCSDEKPDVDSGAIKTRYGLGVMDPTFLFVGRMVLQKGCDILVEAILFVLKVRHESKFIFVGDGHMRCDLESRAHALGVAGSCRFVGKKEGLELHELYQCCDAVVVPSRNEPFGIVVLEAWQAKKPVVATTRGGPRDFVTPGEDGLLVEPTPGSVAWGCCEILANFPHARWMGSRGHYKAARYFSWDSVSGQTLRVYREQMNDHDAPGMLSCAGRGTSISSLVLPQQEDSMGIFGSSPHVTSGMALIRVIKLLVKIVSGSGYLTFMGNEFAHPGPVDCPRPGNRFDHSNASRRWELADNKGLIYKHAELFDAYMTHLGRALRWTRDHTPKIDSSRASEGLIAVRRYHSLVIFNFHAIDERTWLFSRESEWYWCVDTDEIRFGGKGRVDGVISKGKAPTSTVRKAPEIMSIPCRTAIVLTRTVTDFQNQKVLCFQDADDFIQELGDVIFAPEPL